MDNKRSFASDNNAGVHPQILKAIDQANQGHVLAYGDDRYTEIAGTKFNELFGREVSVYFTFLGTAANVLSLKALTDSFHAVVCADTAHIHVDECNAPEKFTGCQLITISTPDGKLTPELIRPHLHGFGFEHHAQPRVISITQSTEMGTLYTPAEIKALADLAHSFGMFLHVDGARIANALVSAGTGLKEMITDTGVDIMSFGGTKNGLMYGEAVVFITPGLDKNFKYYRKQGMQLASKMRFISAQFSGYFENDLWLENAAHANKMAVMLAKSLEEEVPYVKITQKVQANGVFALVPKHLIADLQKQYFFYTWNDDTGEVRWMTSWDTQEEDIRGFVKTLRSFAE